MKPQIYNLGHERTKSFNIINQLGLDEAGAGGDFFRQAVRPVIIGRREGVGHCADEEIWGRFDLAPVVQAAMNNHVTHHAEKMRRVEIEHILRGRMITQTAMIAAQAEHVADPQGCGAQ